MKGKSIGHVVFDHDGTLVNTDNDYQLFDGIYELVNYLADLGVKSYVWTARNRHSTVDILKSLDIISAFEDIYCSTDGPVKPSHVGLSTMLDEVDPSEVIVVGDSIIDMFGAKNFGALAIGVIWANPSESARESLLKSGADYLCESVIECRKLLERLIQKGKEHV